MIVYNLVRFYLHLTYVIKPVSTSPLSQTPTKQHQPTQFLVPLQPVSLPLISNLPEEDEPEPDQQEPAPDQHEPEQEQQEPEPDQHEPEQDQQEPEPEKESEILPKRVSRDLYHADGTPNYGKAALYIRSFML